MAIQRQSIGVLRPVAMQAGSPGLARLLGNRERRRERFLTPDEFRRQGRALAEATTRRRVSPYVVAAIRLLILTRCRKREILHLRWDLVDLKEAELVLAEAKTGPRKVSLSARAVQVLESIERVPDSPWVIPGRVEGKSIRNIEEAWGVVCELAGLRDTRIHDCRHSCATTSFFEEISSASRRNVRLLSRCYRLCFSIISRLGQPRLIFSRQFA